MTIRDLRNLPVEVLSRMEDAGVLDQYGVSYRGATVEAGWDHRQAPVAAVDFRYETRDDSEDKQPVIDGYATTFDQAYRVGGEWGWDETIVSGACTKTLAENDDVFLLFDHAGLPIASTKAGTLDITEDKTGLHSIARPDTRSAWNLEIVQRIEAGELDKMSWAFQVIRQEWNGDYTERFITETKQFDNAIVKWPANPNTSVGVRSADAAPAGMSLALAQTYAALLA